MCDESLAGTVDDVIAYYRDVLASRSGGQQKSSHLKRFDTLVANNKAAAHAEAAVFDFLDLHQRLAPEIFEDASTEARTSSAAMDMSALPSKLQPSAMRH